MTTEATAKVEIEMEIGMEMGIARPLRQSAGKLTNRSKKAADELERKQENIISGVYD